jgi:hypothetical protein
MASFELPWAEHEITPELAELARQALKQQALEKSNGPPLLEEPAVSVSPENEPDVEMADIAQVSRNAGESGKGKSDNSKGTKVSKVP